MEPTYQVDDERPKDTHHDVTNSPLMHLYSCQHDIPPELREKLVDREACPACLVNYHVKVIRDLQDVLDQRGGIFASKTSAATDNSLIPHGDCVHLWVVVKIECYQDISLLEGLCRDDPQQGEQWGIQEALQVWYEARPGLARVPGLGGEAFDAVDFDQLPDIHKANDHGRGTEQQHGAAAIQDKIELSKSAIEATASLEAKLVHSSREKALKDMKDVPHQFKQNMRLEDWVFLNAGADTKTPGDASSTSSPPSTPSPGSALKGSRPLQLHSQLRTSFAEQTTVIPQNFRYGASIDRKPHNKHTSAEDARRQNHFHRTSTRYLPATWSSPEGYEKENSSHFKTSWYRYELMMRTGKWAEKEPDVGSSRNGRGSPFTRLVREVEESLLKKSREKAKKKEALEAVMEDAEAEAESVAGEKKKGKGDGQAESSKVMEEMSEEDENKPVNMIEDAGGQLYSALDVALAEPESKR
ncbi:hypothetical protein IQ06DRAFT_350431 [Phaeosphaeriaceae sp. SRC1lsM3a]|nr:hypothetical protein IQ06DRAFT_350431 [Stagonospora sp. SRC1lsM3a]